MFRPMLYQIYLMMNVAWAETCRINVQVIIYNKACVVLDGKTVPFLLPRLRCIAPSSAPSFSTLPVPYNFDGRSYSKF